MQISSQSNKPAFSGVFNMKGPLRIPHELNPYATSISRDGTPFKFFADGNNIRFSVAKKSDNMVKQILNLNGIEYKYENFHGIRDHRVLNKII